MTRKNESTNELQNYRHTKVLWHLHPNELSWCRYADDLILRTTSAESLTLATMELSEMFQSYLLIVNPAKTKTMISNLQKLTSSTVPSSSSVLSSASCPSSILTLDNKRVQHSEQFCYPGMQICYENNDTGDYKINMRIKHAKAKFASRKRFLCNYKIRLCIQILVFKTEIRSRLTYVCQTWTITMQHCLQPVSPLPD